MGHILLIRQAVTRQVYRHDSRIVELNPVPSIPILIGNAGMINSHDLVYDDMDVPTVGPIKKTCGLK